MMPDEIDRLQEIEIMETEGNIAVALHQARNMPKGRPGKCAECGNDSKRIVGGRCAPCRDGRS